jgi:hypothetical protein
VRRPGEGEPCRCGGCLGELGRSGAYSGGRVVCRVL